MQKTIYNDLGATLLEKAFDGWNGTIFAYGQALALLRALAGRRARAWQLRVCGRFHIRAPRAMYTSFTQRYKIRCEHDSRCAVNPDSNSLVF